MQPLSNYLKKHTELLVKDVGVEKACEVTGRSKATLGRYYSDDADHADRFMPVDVVAQLEAVAKHPHITAALADLRGITMDYDPERKTKAGGVNSDVVHLSQRFATLMGEYNLSIADGKISINEAKRLLAETSTLQRVLMEMKLHLENEAG
jgi:hypothetical protein